MLSLISCASASESYSCLRLNPSLYSSNTSSLQQWSTYFCFLKHSLFSWGSSVSVSKKTCTAPWSSGISSFSLTCSSSRNSSMTRNLFAHYIFLKVESEQNTWFNCWYNNFVLNFSLISYHMDWRLSGVIKISIWMCKVNLNV